MENWYVGSIVFFFEHTNNGVTRVLLLVSLAEENLVAPYDSRIPRVKLFDEDENKSYAVIRVDDVRCSVSCVKTGLIRTYNVISRHIFKKSLASSAGSISNV